jgi:hypothetical protein
MTNDRKRPGHRHAIFLAKSALASVRSPMGHHFRMLAEDSQRAGRTFAGLGEREIPGGQIRGNATNSPSYDPVYSNSHCELSPHDTLLLLTDGLFEVEGPGADIYDYRRLLEAVNRRRHTSGASPHPLKVYLRGLSRNCCRRRRKRLS